MLIRDGLVSDPQVSYWRRIGSKQETFIRINCFFLLIFKEGKNFLWHNRHFHPSTSLRGSNLSLNFQISQSSPSTFIFRSNLSLCWYGSTYLHETNTKSPFCTWLLLPLLDFLNFQDCTWYRSSCHLLFYTNADQGPNFTLMLLSPVYKGIRIWSTTLVTISGIF
jgi:hypothetical protein